MVIYSKWDSVRRSFGLQLGLSVTERLSCTIQGKDKTIQEAMEVAKLTESYLRSLRSEEGYTKFY